MTPAHAIVPRIADSVHFDTLIGEQFWAQYPALEIAHFPWHRAGVKHATRVRCAWNARGIALEFACDDTHISSRIIELNGAVWTDSCVEFFASPHPLASRDYVNLEINACGTFLLAWGPDRDRRRYADPDIARMLTVYHSVQGSLKDEHPDDAGWRIVAFLPFAAIAALAGTAVHPASGMRWLGNFYRCGGQTNPQHACWSPIALPAPDFHCPQFFGELLFD